MWNDLKGWLSDDKNWPVDPYWRAITKAILNKMAEIESKEYSKLLEDAGY